MDMGSMRPRRAERPAKVFASLRVQIILILLACYLIPSLALSIFIQGTLIPGLKEQTASALTADAEHAWNLACQNIDGVIALSREAVYDGELADTYAARASGRMTDDEFLRLSRLPRNARRASGSLGRGGRAGSPGGPRARVPDQPPVVVRPEKLLLSRSTEGISDHPA